MAIGLTPLNRISEIIKRVRRQLGRYDVTIAVDEPILVGHPYMVTMSKSQLVHRTLLDWHNVQRFLRGGNDSLLAREIRLGFAALDRLMRVHDERQRLRMQQRKPGPPRSFS